MTARLCHQALSRWTTAAVLTFAVLAVIAGAPAQSADKAKAAKPSATTRIDNGKQIFDKWCTACHAPNPRLAGTLALQTKYAGAVPAALEQRTDLSPEVVSAFVRNGVAWMAPFRKTEISDAELADLGAYLSRPRKERSK